MDNNLVQDGVVRQIEIVGKATKKVSTEIREKYPDTPWRKMAGTRDKLIHDYLGVDLDAVWDTVVKDIPVLKQTMAKLIEL